MMPTMKGINASCDFFLLFAWIMSFKALLSDLLTYYGISVTKTYNYNILKPSEVHAYWASCENGHQISGTFEYISYWLLWKIKLLKWF